MSKIEQQVMGSVSVIYAGRRLVSATALKFYALLLSLAGIVGAVSMGNVIGNFRDAAQGGFAHLLQFMLVAVEDTTFVVQLALVIAIFAGLFFMRDVLRGESQSFTFA